MTCAGFHLRIVGAAMAALVALAISIWAQSTQFDPGKNVMFPDYYPSTNGIRRLKSVVVGSEYRYDTNGLIWLANPRLTNFNPDGKVEWIVSSAECTLNLKTKSVHGNTNMTFRTADENLFISGVGFLWQQSNAMLILSNQSFTWIDKHALTTNAARYQ